MVNTVFYTAIQEKLSKQAVTLVAVSKLKPLEDLKTLYDLGHKHFGENYVQEL
jgi:PLP dependent protein